MGRCSKLGAQLILKLTINWCAKSELSLHEAQKVGVQMRTLAHKASTSLLEALFSVAKAVLS